MTHQPDQPFDRRIGDTRHRPWPVPDRPWVMAQTWTDLLFAHWPVAAESIRPLLPPGLELDTFDGAAWIGVVPFRMFGVRARGIPPIPRFSDFPELNLRTYAIRDGKPGVWFFSLDAANRVAVAAARRFFYLPYFHAAMRVDVGPDQVRYASRRIHRGAAEAVLSVDYRPTGPVSLAEPGSLDHWLTERYCLYTVDPRERILRLEIHHRQWPLQPAEAEFRTNTLAESHGIRLPATPPLLHFASRIDMVGWRPFVAWSPGS